MTATTVRPADAITQTIPRVPRHLAPVAEPEAHITARIVLSTLLRPADYVGKHRRAWSLGAKLATLGGGAIAILAATVTGTLAMTDGWF